MTNPTFQEGALPRRKQPAEALSGFDSVLPVQGVGIHNTTPPSLSDGDVAIAQLDDLGNLKVTIGDPAQVPESTSKGILGHKVIDVTSTPQEVTVTTGKTFMTIHNIGTRVAYIGDSSMSVATSDFAIKMVPMFMIDFGKVKSTFSFYVACATGETTKIGVAEYA
jgi:hypothetical protein